MSKGGMSITIGRKGFHLNFSKRGVRQTVGLPGSGISESSYILKNKKDDPDSEQDSSAAADEKPARKRTPRTVRAQVSSPWGFFGFILIALFFIYFGVSTFGLLPPHLITNFLHGVTQWAQQLGL